MNASHTNHITAIVYLRTVYNTTTWAIHTYVHEYSVCVKVPTYVHVTTVSMHTHIRTYILT